MSTNFPLLQRQPMINGPFQYFFAPQRMLFIWILLTAFSVRSETEQSIAYRLGAQDESDFHNSLSTKPSSFWSRWESTEGMYQSQLNSSDNGWNRAGAPFASAQDAAITLRFAWGDSGLYVHCSIVDDTICATAPVSFTPSCSTDTRLGDAVDLFFEQYSWSVLHGGDIAGSFPLISCASYGYGTTHLQVSCLPRNGQEQYRSIRYSYSVMGPEIHTGSLGNAYQEGKLILRTHTLSSTQVIIEIGIPWSQWGPFGFFSPPQEGSELSISGGYNDYDPQEENSFNCLRLVPGIDPAGCTQTHAEPRCKPWADLVLGPPLPGTSIRQGTKARNRGKTQPSNGEWFTVTGKRIPSQSALKPKSNSRMVLFNGRLVFQNNF